MSIKSNLTAGVLGVAVAVAAIVVSCFFALLLPTSTRGSPETPPPEVGRSYSKEEIDEKERRAQEDLAKAREEFDRSGFTGLIKNQWTKYLPYVALTALGLVMILGRREKAASVIIMSVPLVVLMLMAPVSIIFPILMVTLLAVYIRLRKSADKPN